MRWRGRRASVNVEDRRSMRIPGKGVVGLGLGGMLIVALYVMLGRDPKMLGDMIEPGAPASAGYVGPESFTHGTSEQRARWFRRGLESGDPAQGDTFRAREL